MRALSFALLLAASAPAAAQTFDTNILGGGVWRFYNNAKGVGECNMMLQPDNTALLNPSCEKEYPALRGVTGWRANGIAIELVDSDGTVAYALDNAGPDVFAASIDGAEFTLDIMPESTPANEKQAEADALQGKYLFKQVNGKTKGCIIELGNEGSYDMYQFVLGDDCEAQYSFVIAMSGWEPQAKGGIRFVGAEGSDMVIFKKNKKGVLEGKSDNDGERYTLTKK